MTVTPIWTPFSFKSGIEEGIYERLVAAIFEHRLAPGMKLGEEGLAAVFGVSRARIRAVLPRLAHEGLVTLEPNRGAFVTQPTETGETRQVPISGGTFTDTFAPYAVHLYAIQ